MTSDENNILEYANSSIKNALDEKCKFFSQAQEIVSTLFRMYYTKLDNGEMSERKKFHSFIREKYFEIIDHKLQNIAEHLAREKFAAYKEYDKNFDIHVEREKEILRNEYRYVFGEGVFSLGKINEEDLCQSN